MFYIYIGLDSNGMKYKTIKKIRSIISFFYTRCLILFKDFIFCSLLLRLDTVLQNGNYVGYEVDCVEN